MSELLLDRARRRRSPATMPGFHAGRPPRNKGLRYPADPPKVEEIVAVMRAAGDEAHGRRLRGLIVILWRAGLRIQEALAHFRGRSRSAPRWAARPAGKARPASRGGHGRVGLGTAAALARAAAPATRRAAAVRHQRSDTRPPLVERRWGRVPMQSAARGRARGASEFRPDREPRAREWRCSFPARSDSGRRGAGPQVLLP